LEAPEVTKPQRPPTSSKPSIRPVTMTKANSDSSVADKLKDEKSRERKEQREHRHRSEKDRSEKSTKDEKHKSSRKDRKKGVPLDIIDKLDVTGLFGPGSFHHDGPFDACTPHRNKNTKKAPVLAFPADGANNSLTADPSTKYATENKIFGRSNVDDPEFNGSKGLFVVRAQAKPFDSGVNQTPVHGDTTMGLGSSTFLDGTPASQGAIAKSGEEVGQGATLGRKKSLVAKLRGGNGPGPVIPAKPGRMGPPPVPSSSAGTVETITRTSSHPVQSPSMKESLSFEESVRSVSPNDRDGAPAVNGGGGGGLLRRVKSLKVGSRRKS
jgi:hypothetical protein